MAAPRITLYTTRSCPNCRKAKHYLQQRGLRFQELDVKHSPRAQKEFARLGGRGVPLIMVGDQQFSGFNPQQLKTALARAGLLPLF